MSNITSLKCFGIYTGLVVICDFFLMITYLPAVVMIDHLYIRPRVDKCNCICKACGALPLCNKCCGPEEEEKKGSELGPGERTFQNYISPVLNKGRWFWIIILGAVGLGLGWKSQFLKKPSTGDFQLFHAGNAMEDYEMIYNPKFYQSAAGQGSGGGAFYPVTFVWGLEAIDNGDNMDPYSHGSPVWTNLDVKSPGAQNWLLDFCLQARNESWYLPLEKVVAKYENCFMEDFKKWVEWPCENTTSVRNWDDLDWMAKFPSRNGDEEIPCCGMGFPLPTNKLSYCLPRWGRFFGDYNLGVFYTTDGTNAVKALVYNFVTNVEFTNNYGEAEELYKTLSDFETRMISSAPPNSGLDKGFMTSQFAFYDLQKSISTGAYQSAGASAVIAFLVLMMTTRNIILTFYSTLTIIMICAVCTGVLVMDNWELNILESIIFSVAVGMSVDFVAHYSHAYNDAPEEEGEAEGGEEEGGWSSKLPWFLRGSKVKHAKVTHR